MKITTIEELEEAIGNANHQHIIECFGEDVKANLGWGVDSNDEAISFASKVYLKGGAQVVVTDGKIGDEPKDFVHRVEPY